MISTNNLNNNQMSKKLFAFIFSFILFQYVYNSACTEKENPADNEACQVLTTSVTSKKCVFVAGGEGEQSTCQEEVKDCREITSGATDTLCKELKVSDNDFLCLKNGDACEEKKKCNSATGKDDAACKNFAVETKGNICKKDTAENSNKCKEVKEESTKSTKSTESTASTQSGNNLTFSLPFIILLFLF